MGHRTKPKRARALAMAIAMLTLALAASQLAHASPDPDPAAQLAAQGQGPRQTLAGWPKPAATLSAEQPAAHADCQHDDPDRRPGHYSGELDLATYRPTYSPAPGSEHNAIAVALGQCQRDAESRAMAIQIQRGTLKPQHAGADGGNDNAAHYDWQDLATQAPAWGTGSDGLAMAIVGGLDPATTYRLRVCPTTGAVRSCSPIQTEGMPRTAAAPTTTTIPLAEQLSSAEAEISGAWQALTPSHAPDETLPAKITELAQTLTAASAEQTQGRALASERLTMSAAIAKATQQIQTLRQQLADETKAHAETESQRADWQTLAERRADGQHWQDWQDASQAARDLQQDLSAEIAGDPGTDHGQTKDDLAGERLAHAETERQRGELAGELTAAKAQIQTLTQQIEGLRLALAAHGQTVELPAPTGLAVTEPATKRPRTMPMALTWDPAPAAHAEAITGIQIWRRPLTGHPDHRELTVAATLGADATAWQDPDADPTTAKAWAYRVAYVAGELAGPQSEPAAGKWRRR